MARRKHPKPTYEAHIASRRARGLEPMTEKEWLANRERVAASRRRRRAALRAEREMEVCPACGGSKWHPMIDPPGILDGDECCDILDGDEYCDCGCDCD